MLLCYHGYNTFAAAPASLSSLSPIKKGLWANVAILPTSPASDGLEINASAGLRCMCTFPLPTMHPVDIRGAGRAPTPDAPTEWPWHSLATPFLEAIAMVPQSRNCAEAVRQCTRHASADTVIMHMRFAAELFGPECYSVQGSSESKRVRIRHRDPSAVGELLAEEQWQPRPLH